MEVNNNKFTYHSAALEALTSMSEYDLQNRIIEPLLRLNGFQDVRDQSGRGEKGKDLTAIKYELGKPKLYAIQIKKIKLTGKSSGNRSLNNLVAQLRQTMLEEVFDRLSNSHRVPERGIFITPFPINRDAIESAIKQVTELENREITIIDDPILVDLILKYMPSVIPEIGPEIMYRMQLAKAADNIQESKAFGLKDNLSLDQIYVEVDVMGWTPLLGQ